MATAEHAMWVTKRYPALGNKTGFVMVPDAQREALVLDGGAQDTFSGLSFVSPAPPITAVTFTPAALATDAAVGATAGTLAATGGTSPYEYQLLVNPGSAYVIDGATVKTAVTPLPAGAVQIGGNARDAAGRNKPWNGTVTVTTPAPPAVQSVAKTTTTKTTAK